MKKILLFLSLLLLLTCAKEDSQAPNTPPTQIVKQYTLTASAGDGGSVTGGGTFASGTQVSLTATPSSGYSFSGWSNGSTANPLTVTLNSNTTITANFQVIVNSYTLSVTAGEGGSVSSEGGEYEEGTEVTITAIPDEGYKFIGWSDGEASAERVITITQDNSIEALFEIEIIYFQSLSPVYSQINESTTFYKENYYSPNIHMTPWQKSELMYKENCYDQFNTNCALRYAVWGTYNGIYLDFNNDQKLDYFVWTNPVTYDEQGSYQGDPGMYIVIEDYFNEFNIHYRITDDVRFEGRPEIGDFNGDGRDDILVYNQNHHGKWDGAEGPVYDRRNLKILYFNDDGTFSESDIGIEGGSHAMSTMDIENDGDLDIIFGHMGGIRIPGDLTDRISIYINDGFGNFEQKNELFKYPDEFYDYVDSSWDMFSRPHHNVAGMDTFDIDGDGYLDIITGNGPTCGDDQPNYFWEADIRIYWGDNSYTYDYNRSLKIDADCNLNDTYNFSFIDYNLDGKMDILYSGPGRQGDIMIGLLKNNGNKDFSDVTSQQIDKNSIRADGSPIAFNNDSDLPGGVRFSIIDVDGDGDFDIFPYDIHTSDTWLWTDNPDGINDEDKKFNLPDNSIFAYWENNGGYFTFKRLF